jgi:hypothetical protein
MNGWWCLAETAGVRNQRTKLHPYDPLNELRINWGIQTQTQSWLCAPTCL